MSGFVPRRVSMTRTAMGSTDANSSGKNGHSIVSTIGRRSTLRNKIQSRAFGSMWQIDYMNAAGNKCERERLVPSREAFKNLTLNQNNTYDLTIYNDGFDNKSFMRQSLYKALEDANPTKYRTDRYCASGAINNNVDKIIIGPAYTSNTLSTECVGKEILAIGRWQNAPVTPEGWGVNGLNNGDSVYVAYSGSISNVNVVPHFKFNGITATPSVAPPNIASAITNFQGVTIPQFTVVMYGPGTTPTANWLDNIFNSGFDVLNGEKKITLELA